MCYSLDMNKGHLTYTRRNITVDAEIIWSRPVYTMVRETATGRIHLIRTDHLSSGSESHHGHVSFRVA